MVNETQAFLYCNMIVFNGRMFIRLLYHVTNFDKQLERRKVLGIFKLKVAIVVCLCLTLNYSGCCKHLDDLLFVKYPSH